MSMMPNFAAVERAYMEPPDDVEQCPDGDCDECMECLACIAQEQADAYAEMQREEARFESRWGK